MDGLLQSPPAAAVTGPAKPAGYLISHEMNDSFIVVNRLLKAKLRCVLAEEAVTCREDAGTGHDLGARVAPRRSAIVDASARQLGVRRDGAGHRAAGEAMKLKPIRIGLYDQYGGLMPSGWTRWLFEQYEFPFEVIYPQTLDAGDLKSKFDVLVFVDGDGALSAPTAAGAAAGAADSAPDAG